MPHADLSRIDRRREIERLRAASERDDFPRLRMLLIVVATGGCGFLASSLLLHAGLQSMLLRYPLALACAYAAFLALLGAWLRIHTHGAPDLPDDGGWSTLDASGSPSADPPAVPGSDFAGLDLSDDFALPLLAIAFVAIVAFASLWIVFAAPTLFAELLFDGVLAAGLYRRLRHGDRRHWLDTALRRTAWPFALTLVALLAFGLVVHLHRPDVHSLGQLLHRPVAEAADAR